MGACILQLYNISYVTICVFLSLWFDRNFLVKCQFTKQFEICLFYCFNNFITINHCNKLKNYMKICSKIKTEIDEQIIALWSSEFIVDFFLILALQLIWHKKRLFCNFLTVKMKRKNNRTKNGNAFNRSVDYCARSCQLVDGRHFLVANFTSRAAKIVYK